MNFPKPLLLQLNWQTAVGIAIGVWIMCWIFGRLWSRWFNPKQGANSIHEDAKKLYSSPHEFVPADPADFPWADLSFYQAAESQLMALGFRKLGDIEDATVSRVYPKMRTFIRTLASGDGVTMAGIYHVKIRGWMKLLTLVRVLPAHMRSIDLETELADGTFVTTGNTLGLDLSSPVPGVERQSLPPDTPPQDLVCTHRQRITELMAERGNPRLAQTAHDYIAAQHRLDAIKSRAKAAAGYVDLAQFDRCGKGLSETKEITQMREELARLQDEELMAGSRHSQSKD